MQTQANSENDPVREAAHLLGGALRSIWRLQHDGCTDEEWDAAWDDAEKAMDAAYGSAAV